MAVYICGVGNISIQPTLKQREIAVPVVYSEPFIRCIDPDFKEFIAPMLLRRMSPIVKRAIVSSVVALKDAGIEAPEAIISGTGLGCIDDTEKFLNAIIEQDEQFLQPTYFIQSTHNTISSQIAIHLKSHVYNNTYTHRGISFENALLDAFVLMNTGQINSALVGGFDEMTPAYFQILKKLGNWKDKVENSLAIFEDKTPGSFAGEGSVSFVLSTKEDTENYAEIAAIQFIYNPENQQEINDAVLALLQQQHLKPEDVDVLMTGISGDSATDHHYLQLADALFADTPHVGYKNLSGEFYTAPAFGLWSAATCLKNKAVPEVQRVNAVPIKKVNTILLYNQYKGKNHSLILLK